MRHVSFVQTSTIEKQLSEQFFICSLFLKYIKIEGLVKNQFCVSLVIVTCPEHK